jgi:hypothetical protein
MKKLIFVLSILAASVFSSLAADTPWKITPWEGALKLPQLIAPKADHVFELPAFLTDPTNWTEYTFSPGDTTTTFSVNHASIVYFMIADSSLTGTDTVWIGIQVTLDNGRILKAPVAVHNVATTTQTTYVAPPLIIAGNGATAVFAFNPLSIGGAKFTGIFFLARTNVNDNVTPYLPRTRLAFAYE